MNLSTLAGGELLIPSCKNTKHFFAKAFTALFLLSFIVQFNLQAQAPPSCSLSGPLKATAHGADIEVKVHVANSTPNPHLKYLIKNNGSHAIIRATGLLVYDAAKNSSTQSLLISPGDTPAGFNLEIMVTTPNGTGRCSKSVSVSN